MDNPTTRGSDRLPIPDPTVLTTQQLLREMGLLRDLIDVRFGVVETRFDGMDKAIALIQSEADKVPSKTDIAVDQLKDLHAEKFRSIETQFIERDTRTEQTSRDSKVAVDAALQAAKEAVGEQNKSNSLANSKMEASFTKQIDQIGTLITTSNKATDDKISDIKDRLNSIEGQNVGSHNVWGYVIGAAGVLVAMIAIAAAVLLKMSLK
jgi:hypothetical protein